MRRLLTAGAVAILAATIAGCGGATSNDPYEITHRATDAQRDSIQVEIGFALKSGSTDVTIDKSAIRVIVDSKAGKGSFHLALPIAELGIDAASLAQLGVTGDSLDLDILFDGDGLYAKSPALGAALAALLAQMGNLPDGDMTGWLRLGTMSDFEAIGETLGGIALPSALPSLPVPTSVDTATFKKNLEDAGIVLSFVGTEQRNGVDSNHVKATVDVEKLSKSPGFAGLSQTELGPFTAMAADMSVAADLWFDKANDRIVEVDVHADVTGTDAGTVDVTVTMSDPPAGTTFDAPSSFVAIPIQDLVTEVMQMLGPQLFGG